MDYKEKYNKLVEAVKVLQETNPSDEGIQNWVNDNVSELKESEDERIRKWIIGVLSTYEHDRDLRNAAIAWLEKQGELIRDTDTVDSNEDGLIAETIRYKNEKQGEQKPATIDIDKMVDDYANNKERGNEEFGKPVNCMIKAYRQGLIDAIGKVVLKPAWR